MLLAIPSSWLLTTHDREAEHDYLPILQFSFEVLFPFTIQEHPDMGFWPVLLIHDVIFEFWPILLRYPVQQLSQREFTFKSYIFLFFAGERVIDSEIFNFDPLHASFCSLIVSGGLPGHGWVEGLE